jgi:hypothetical protein
MATSQISNLESADDLQVKIKTAEQHLLAALSNLPPDHPVSLAANELLSAHAEVREMVRHAYEAGVQEKKPEFSSTHEAEAAIQIEREHHTLKPDFKDILKALFMWRDDPAKVVRDKGELQSDLKNAPL